FKHPPTPHTYTLSLHDALPISNNAPVRLNADQSFTNAVNTTISLNFATNFVDLNGHTLTCDGAGSLSLGLLTGSGNLIQAGSGTDRKSTRLNSSHLGISYAVFC